MAVKKPLCNYSGKIKELQNGDTVSGTTGTAYDPGTVTIATERFLLQYQHLKLSGSERATLAGTARVKIADLGDLDSVIIGTPRVLSMNAIVQDCCVYDITPRLDIRARTTLQGSARIVVTDDFNTRSRIVLAGRG
jgi:hypothetical protein